MNFIPHFRARVGAHHRSKEECVARKKNQSKAKKKKKHKARPFTRQLTLTSAPRPLPPVIIPRFPKPSAACLFAPRRRRFISFHSSRRRSKRQVEAEREREERRREDVGKPHPTELLRAEARNALHLIGLGGEGVTHDDEMNARMVSELDQLEAYRRSLVQPGPGPGPGPWGTGGGGGPILATPARGLSPMVRDAVSEAIAADAQCANLFVKKGDNNNNNDDDDNNDDDNRAIRTFQSQQGGMGRP